MIALRQIARMLLECAIEQVRREQPSDSPGGQDIASPLTGGGSERATNCTEEDPRNRDRNDESLESE